MKSLKMVYAPISIEFSLAEDNEGFEREFQRMSESDDDPIMQWLKLAKARGETQDSDMLLVNLVVELHRKIDNLERIVKEETLERIALKSREMVERIAFEYFELKEEVFVENEYYYCRISMPTYPRRDVPLFFKAVSPKVAHIHRMHERDEKDWNGYVRARERVMIREMKGRN